MSGLVISLSYNILKLTLNDSSSIRSTSLKVSEDIVDDSRIIDPQLFAEVLGKAIQDFSLDKKNKPSLSFILEPQDTILHFITTNKKDGDTDEQLIRGIKDRLSGQTLEELYFSYQKIAPFVYQFAGVKRSVIDNILAVSAILGLELRSIVPWILLLPKLLGTNEPSIFITKDREGEIIALSELGGVYFCDTYEAEKRSLNLEKLVKDLSVYKRSVPINKIYTFEYSLGSLDPTYEVIPLVLPEQYLAGEIKEFEKNQLLSYISDFDSDLLNTQVNFIHMLPLPVVEKSNKALVYVGSGIAILMILVGSTFFFVSRNSKISAGKIAMTNETPKVLSEADTNKETTQSTPSTPVPVINKADIKIRVENGAGIEGMAARTKSFFTGLGYTVLSIGNSQKPIRNDTLISFKKGKTQYKDVLTRDMEKNYKLTFDEDLVDSAEYDVLITVGTN